MKRTLLRVSGDDREKFLHGLLTRDVPETGLGYAALLTPQGKYLADFLTFRDADALYLDVATDFAAGLAQRLTMYRLRSKVAVEDAGLTVARGLDDMPDGAMADPRPGMGWRHYGATGGDGVDWDAVRVANIVPESGIELIPGESYILEMGFERLGGVDFRKGCFVGQEIVARMKHKTELRKGLVRVRGAVVPGAGITNAGRDAGTVHTVSGDRALAYLRFDRADGMETDAGPLALD
ncbi:CAF17-like 4Fe-4S cluster assembly/insertion protein YgfZ [Jannaschia donghaensis]|uniref:Putative global regulator n=1 Tax=Jannaschia donghaensis TaxID=420998 RepID=A0A0M6YG85_9RHOB|nr:folate-binding protein YgfZ [Jannaschia donghaensis]CTQ48685.1 putative global regulator [Jannaschia donghaensis]